MILLLSGCAVERPLTTSASKDDEARAAIAGTCKPGKTSGNVNCVEEVPNSLTATKSRVCNSKGKGFDLGACVVSGCKPGYHLSDNKCLPNACTPGKDMGVVECSAENAFSRIATKSRSCNNSGNDYVYGPCIASGCSTGYSLSAGKCVPEPCRANEVYGSIDCKEKIPFSTEASKAIKCSASGVGFISGSCTVSKCSANHRLESNSCVPIVCEANQSYTPESCVEHVSSSKEAVKSKTCNAKGTAYEYGDCVAKSCKDGFYLDRDSNTCLAQTCIPNQELTAESCYVADSLLATSTRRCDSRGMGILFGPCLAKSCADGFELVDGFCRETLNSKFLKSCGYTANEFYSKNASEMTGSYTSLPIVIEGQKQVLGSSFQYRIILSSKAQLIMNGGLISFSNELNLTTVDLESSLSSWKGLLLKSNLKSSADSYARDMTIKTDSKVVSVSDWLNMTEFDESFANLRCAPMGSSSTKSWTSRGEILTNFSPLLLNHLSPVVSIDRLKLEFSDERSFNVIADVKSARESKDNPNLKIGLKSGTVTIRKIAPTLSVVNAAANVNSTISGETAYEIINDFPGGAYTVGLPKRLVYLLDASKKKVIAFSLELDNPAGEDLGLKQNIPIIYVRENSN